ncbi:hypothetical protein PCANC_22278 [Puccinia coronata f. sp. avenae]|uniref:Uncharacterized protein n=1 Tax=Puccinia coronata f. sp. avenae TaxID=200324 RepID=A0A2N5UTL2_9BASI|nr:hypothetical protein PCANC_22278 [Puccinia coronata f. sp. avenae]
MSAAGLGRLLPVAPARWVHAPMSSAGQHAQYILAPGAPSSVFHNSLVLLCLVSVFPSSLPPCPHLISIQWPQEPQNEKDVARLSADAPLIHLQTHTHFLLDFDSSA